VVSGTPQSATVNTAFTSALQAKVTDSASNPLSGVTVTFTARLREQAQHWEQQYSDGDDELIRCCDIADSHSQRDGRQLQRDGNDYGIRLHRQRSI
jgi:hypothetical protein